ncbi:hypothetical protein CKA32_002727 [Geitlerinema sp. FC II]|nr:hypothetical protein CKA32_002727 [Geitlerinema sp. FC II]
MRSRVLFVTTVSYELLQLYHSHNDFEIFFQAIARGSSG